MDIAELATNLMKDKLGTNADTSQITSALSGLLGDGQGGIDLAGLAGKMSQNGSLGSLLSSWLGDGPNDAISASSVTDLLGKDSLGKFAEALGTDPDSAAASLTEVLPEVVDKSSSGGSLLDSVGGLGGLLNAAKSFLK